MKSNYWSNFTWEWKHAIVIRVPAVSTVLSCTLVFGMFCKCSRNFCSTFRCCTCRPQITHRLYALLLTGLPATRNADGVFSSPLPPPQAKLPFDLCKCLKARVFLPLLRWLLSLSRIRWLLLLKLQSSCVHHVVIIDCMKLKVTSLRWVYVVSQLVEALRYKPEGCGFDFRWGHRDRRNHSGRTMVLGSTQPLIEMSTSVICRGGWGWGCKAADAWGWQPYYLNVPIARSAGSLNLLEPQGPVQA